MPRRIGTHELALPPPPPGIPLFHWLYQELRSAILDGRLRPGARLPSSRDLARQCGVARGTVVAAFAQLCVEGYIESRVGAGTVVAALLPEEVCQAHAHQTIEEVPLPSAAGLSQRGQRLAHTPFPLDAITDIGRPFRAGQPALDAFPYALWARLAARVQRQAARVLFAQGDGRGYGPLREAVAAYLGAARGVNCTPEQVVIVSSVQLALNLAARLVLDPGDAAWIEDPGYPGARYVLAAAGVQVIPVPVDAEGLDIARGCQLGPQAKLVYVTPARHCPLGMPMSLDRRLALLTWARHVNAWIFEDDYDSEYRYRGRPLAALQGLDTSGSVIYAGSFNKVLFPALRLAYVVVPPRLLDAFVAARTLIDRHPPVLDQAILSEFMGEGHFARHIRRMRALYATRLHALLDAAHTTLDGLLDITAVDAGLETVGWLPRGLDDRRVATAAAAWGLEIRPLSAYAMRYSPIQGVVLGFAAVRERDILDAVPRLAQVVQEIYKYSTKRSMTPRRLNTSRE